MKQYLFNTYGMPNSNIEGIEVIRKPIIILLEHRPGKVHRGFRTKPMQH